MCLTVRVLTSFLRRCMHLTMCEYSVRPTHLYMYMWFVCSRVSRGPLFWPFRQRMLCSHESDVPSPLANEPGCVMRCMWTREGREGRRRKEEGREGGEWEGIRRSWREYLKTMSPTKSNNQRSNLSCFFFALSIHCAGSGCDQHERGEVYMRASHHRARVYKNWWLE